MKSSDSPKIMAIILRVHIDKSTGSPDFLYEALTTEEWQHQKEICSQKFRKVFAELPKKVRGNIQRVWAEAPFYDVKTGKHTPGPLLVFVDKLNERCRELGRPQWGNTDGFTYSFDADVVLNGRPAVSSFLIAQMLACTYQVAIRGKHGLEQKGIDLEADRLVKEWGFHLLSDSGKPLVAKTYTIWNQS